MKDSVIFDFDGTICQSLGLIVECLQKKTSKKLNLQILRTMTSKEFVEYVGLSYFELPSMILDVRKAFKRDLLNQKIVPQIHESILNLKARGIKLHVLSSNSEENIKLWLKNNSLEDVFDSVNSAFTIFGKSREIKSLLKNRKINKRSCVYIGDETRDLEASKSLGLDSIAVSWGYNTLELLQRFEPSYSCNKPNNICELTCFSIDILPHLKEGDF